MKEREEREIKPQADNVREEIYSLGECEKERDKAIRRSERDKATRRESDRER